MTDAGPLQEAVPVAGYASDAGAPEATAGGVPDASLPQVQNIEELDLASLLGTVNSVSRKEESVLRAPAAVTTLDATDLRRSGATSLPDLLRAVPGVQVYRSAPGNFTISIRGTGGLGSNNAVVMVDGIPINSPIDGSVDWSIVPVELRDIQRVEVVRGPVSTIYGANAYTGVINIITTRPADAGGEIAVRAGGGLDVTGHPIGLVGGRASGGESVKWSVAATAVEDQSFSSETTAGANQPALQKASGLARLEVPLGESSRLVIEGMGGYSSRSSNADLVLEANPQKNATALGTIRYEATGLPSIFDTFTAWTRASYLNVQTDPTLYRGFSFAGASGWRTEGGVDLGVKLPLTLTGTVGANASLTQVNAPFIHPLENGKARGGYGFYAVANAAPVEQLSLTLGARGDISDVTGALEFSYRASAIWATSSASFRISAASAYRTPTWVEAGGRFVDPSTGLILLEGSPNLKSPRIDSGEIAAIIEPVSRLSVTPTIYILRMSNLMVENFDPLVRKTFTNDPANRVVLGGELEVRWKPSTEFSLFGTFGAIGWLSGGGAGAVGVPSQSSTITAALRAQGAALDDRLRYGGGIAYGSPRSYSLSAGIPPEIIAVSVDHVLQLDVGASYRPVTALPLAVFVRLLSYLPNGQVESPFPPAGTTGTLIMAGVEFQH